MTATPDRHRGDIRSDEDGLRMVCTCGHATPARSSAAAARQDFDGHLTDATPPTDDEQQCTDQPALFDL